MCFLLIRLDQFLHSENKIKLKKHFYAFALYFYIDFFLKRGKGIIFAGAKIKLIIIEKYF